MPGSRPRKAKAVRPQMGRRHSPGQASPHDSKNFAVVAIGASAGGLDACTNFMKSMPENSGMAFILVQHLDPTHESMMVELLARHTSMTVRQAENGMPLEREHLYIIPPGAYLSVNNGTLQLSQPPSRHGVRLPFDFLLRSLAEEYGRRTICVILSGTGADGSLGLKAVKEKHGFVVVQDPNESGYDGMPRNAIITGAVDLVLPVAKIPEALAEYNRRAILADAPDEMASNEGVPNWRSEIIELLRTKTPHDFTRYKLGTLQRRIERRMGMAGIEADNMDRYLALLRSNSDELNLLATDMLINVTSFFRDPKIYDFLAKKILPDLIANRMPDQPLRIWIAGCSTGEETYSLAMVFREQIKLAKSDVKLQFFASDVDPDAIACAREGLYPTTIEADVSRERLARFFTKEASGYRVLPELRATVIFTVQDVLADPPFSRLDMVSCRNLLIYLLPEAQAKVISLFHFALREGGILLLGSAETIGNVEGRFEVISKPERLYRQIGRRRHGDVGFSMSSTGGVRIPARMYPDQTKSRQTTLGDLCRRLILEIYAPAAVLINCDYECLYYLGPTDYYLKVAPGHPANDLLAMARDGVRTKLRAAIQRACQDNTRIVVPGGRIDRDGTTRSYSVTVQPVVHEGETLLLICFIDEPKQRRRKGSPSTLGDAPRIAELEQELEATSAELQGAIRNLEISGEEQRAIYEEALSINEEFQSTNEELLTSKEELQSVNEELTALNSQLQETLERQRTTSDDLQNVLYSTNVATIFLDTQLNIRFFTPATKLLFSVIPGDVGRPLADLSSLAIDESLLEDAHEVLRSLTLIEREIEAGNDTWFVRRILPYRTQDNRIEGVVITYSDVTERKRAAVALAAAEQQAQRANVVKSRFLAAASHDLRQPLQTLVLLQGMLAKTVEDEKSRNLVSRIDDILDAMSGMLNTLLDINQIEAGTIHVKIVSFPINELFDRIRDEFIYLAKEKALALHVVPCSLSIQTDPRLLEQMVRNLLSNALKYTKQGKVLLGCRRRKGMLSIEVWDTGIGIPDSELEAIFEEYHQLDNPARERSLGLGLGLSIVHRLGNLLNHRVHVRSRPGKGSTFVIEVTQRSGGAPMRLAPRSHDEADPIAQEDPKIGQILVVEDDPAVCDMLELLLKEDGHRVTSAHNGVDALELIARENTRFDLILADYNLPNGMNGLMLIAKAREALHRQIPAIILTGDTSAQVSRQTSLQNCIQLNKPVKSSDLTQVIRRLLLTASSSTHKGLRTPESATRVEQTIIFVIDDERDVRSAIRGVIEASGRTVEDFADSETFLDFYKRDMDACLVVDAYLPGMSGLELLRRIKKMGYRLPAIMITGKSDVAMAVEAMKAGASDFIEKPVGASELLASIERALERSRDASKLSIWHENAVGLLAELTSRQRQILDMVLRGHPSKNIAADLGISQRTVENHRAMIMKKTGSKSLPALARLAFAATWTNNDDPIN